MKKLHSFAVAGLIACSSHILLNYLAFLERGYQDVGGEELLALFIFALVYRKLRGLNKCTFVKIVKR